MWLLLYALGRRFVRENMQLVDALLTINFNLCSGMKRAHQRKYIISRNVRPRGRDARLPSGE